MVGAQHARPYPLSLILVTVARFVGAPGGSLLQ
jgi:hypothetical protein